MRFAARCRNTMPSPTKNKIPQINTGHGVPVAPETAKNSVATPATAVAIVNGFHSMPSSIRVGGHSTLARVCAQRGSKSTGDGRGVSLMACDAAPLLGERAGNGL